MRAEHQSATGCHGDGILHFRAHANHRLLEGGGQFQRRRRVAARAAQHDGRAAGSEARDGIVHRPRDGAVVAEKEIRDARKPLARFVIVGAERFVREIGAGGDERAVRCFHQQQMQGRGWQQRAEPRVSRSHTGGQLTVRSLRHQHDRALRRL